MPSPPSLHLPPTCFLLHGFPYTSTASWSLRPFRCMSVGLYVFQFVLSGAFSSHRIDLFAALLEKDTSSHPPWVRPFLRKSVLQAHLGNTLHNAQYTDLLPAHYWNILACTVSTICLGLWLFFSPHAGPQATNLDRTLGSFVTAQCVCNIFYTASCSMNCVGSLLGGTILGMLNNFLSVMSIIFTNLMAHR